MKGQFKKNDAKVFGVVWFKDYIEDKNIMDIAEQYYTKDKNSAAILFIEDGSGNPPVGEYIVAVEDRGEVYKRIISVKYLPHLEIKIIPHEIGL